MPRFIPQGAMIMEPIKCSSLEEVVDNMKKMQHQGNNLDKITVEDLKDKIWWAHPFGAHKAINGKNFWISTVQFAV